MEQKYLFACLDHPSEPIARIDPTESSERDLYCTECLFNAKDPQALGRRVQKIDAFLTEVANCFSQHTPKNIEKSEVPKEFSEVLDQRSEFISLVSQRIESEKTKLGKIFDQISASAQEIITQKRKQYMTLLDNQLENFTLKLSSLDNQIGKAYPDPEKIHLFYPTLQQLTSRVQEVKDSGRFAGIIKDLKQDLHTHNNPNREEIILNSIKNLTSQILAGTKMTPALSGFEIKEQVSKLESHIQAFLDSSVKFENVITGPLAVSLNNTPETSPLTEIAPSSMSVQVSSTVYGGGTGREYPENLLEPGNHDWNKWYTGNTGEQWIQLTLPEPKVIKFYGLKSANDCEGRDPCTWQALGKTEAGEWEVFHEVKGVKFDRRFQFKYFAVNSKSKYTEVRFSFKTNRGFEEQGYWSDGMQLCEVSLFESK